VRKLRFLVSLITKENDFQREQAASAETAARELGVDLDVVYADGDTITQSTQILKCIQTHAALRPSGIIVEPAGGTGLPQVAKAAVEANGGKLTLESVNGTGSTFRITLPGLDAVATANRQGAAAAALSA